ncbi:MAG: protein-ADP-ribose hydrolase [Oscillospiraceae bacterium]|nr:protein-ADP-ribose hydrolase [Oscillospiraceae bacterium]
MERIVLINKLNQILLDEMPMYKDQVNQFADDVLSQRDLLRSLMNVRPPMPLSNEYLELQDELLSAERDEKGVVDAMTLPTMRDSRLVLWQGDITRLKVDAIVNAANSAILGCFCPCHGCIDNAIHSAAGLQLRDECNQIMTAQGHDEPTGQAKLTKAYNLPSKFVLHTVGPIIHGELTQADCEDLASCYRSCLAIATEHSLKSVAFCCISTGEFHFPNQKATEIAVAEVKRFLGIASQIERIVFNVFKSEDEKIYRSLL